MNERRQATRSKLWDLVFFYRGEQYDQNLSLYYLRARYMNPVTGRFMSRDPNDPQPIDPDQQLYDADVPRVDPRAFHKYLYAYGDPVNIIDPRGREGAEEDAGAKLESVEYDTVEPDSCRAAGVSCRKTTRAVVCDGEFAVGEDLAMKKAATYLQDLAVAFSLAAAFACFYYSVEIGVTGEEGLKYNPDVSLHPAWRNMQVLADRWSDGAAAFLLLGGLLAGWQLFRYIFNRRVRARPHSGSFT